MHRTLDMAFDVDCICKACDALSARHHQQKKHFLLPQHSADEDDEDVIMSG